MKNYFDRAMSYGNLRRALRKCCRDVRWKDSVVGYELHAPQNTHKLMKEIREGTYRISEYQRFVVLEPKRREIVATRIADRQVQMALCDGGLYEDITEHFIYDNCACQRGKGVDFALRRLKTHLLRYYRKYGADGWVLSGDVKQFFQSTEHSVAKDATRKRVEDTRAREMTFAVIDSFDGEVGIGLGSEISQLVELAVLDDMDHMIKERLWIRHYIRYMDDFILIHPDKEYLKTCREAIEKHLAGIGLELNRKTTIYPLRQGVKFLQWRYLLTETGKVVMRMNRKRLKLQRRRMRKIAEREKNGSVKPGTLNGSFQSWEANAKRGDAWKQRKRMYAAYRRMKGEIDNG